MLYLSVPFKTVEWGVRSTASMFFVESADKDGDGDDNDYDLVSGLRNCSL